MQATKLVVFGVEMTRFEAETLYAGIMRSGVKSLLGDLEKVIRPHVVDRFKPVVEEGCTPKVPFVQVPPATPAPAKPLEGTPHKPVPLTVPKQVNPYVAVAPPAPPKPVPVVKMAPALGTCKGKAIVRVVATQGEFRTVEVEGGQTYTQKQGKGGKWALARGKSVTVKVIPVKPQDRVVTQWTDPKDGVQYTLTLKADGSKTWESVAARKAS